MRVVVARVFTAWRKTGMRSRGCKLRVLLGVHQHGKRDYTYLGSHTLTRYKYRTD